MTVKMREAADRRLAALKSERTSFWSHWKEINEFLLPRRGRFLTGREGVNRGDKRNQKIIDGEATQALNILVSGMMSGVTSPARKWFRLVPPDMGMLEFGPVKSWLHAVETIIYEIFSQSNLYQVLPYVYEEMATYGTAAVINLEDFDTVTRFQAFTVGEYCIAQDHRYKVNTIYREIPLTVEQIVGAYGEENATHFVKEQWRKGNNDTWVPCVHLVEPRTERDVDSPFAKDKPFKSIIFETGNDKGTFLHEGGFDRFPVYSPRWHLTLPDVYGRSPGMDALGDVKQLQDQQKKKGQAIAKMVNPPMTAPAALKNERITTLPGDVTYVDTAQGQQGFVPAYQVQPRLNEFLLDIQDVRSRIRRAFYADLFLMLANDARAQRATATEIDERREEKLLVLGPVLERINHDLLAPLIDDVFTRIVETGIAPPPPRELAGTELKVEYISIMAMAQRAQGILGIQDTAMFVGSLASINPEVVDKFDFDQAVDEFGERRGVPPGVVRADDVVEQLRGQRAQQQQAMQAAEAMSSAAQGAKVLSDADTGKQSLLTDIMGGMTPG